MTIFTDSRYLSEALHNTYEPNGPHGQRFLARQLASMQWQYYANRQWHNCDGVYIRVVNLFDITDISKSTAE